MSSTADLIIRLNVDDGTTGANQLHFDGSALDMAVEVAPNGKRYPQTLAVGDNAVDAPNPCAGMIVHFVSGTAPTIVLKGSAGDDGIALCDGALPSFPLVMPVFDDAGIVLNVDVEVEIEVIFF